MPASAGTSCTHGQAAGQGGARRDHLAPAIGEAVQPRRACTVTREFGKRRRTTRPEREEVYFPFSRVFLPCGSTTSVNGEGGRSGPPSCFTSQLPAAGLHLAQAALRSLPMPAGTRQQPSPSCPDRKIECTSRRRRGPCRTVRWSRSRTLAACPARRVHAARCLPSNHRSERHLRVFASRPWKHSPHPSRRVPVPGLPCRRRPSWTSSCSYETGGKGTKPTGPHAASQTAAHGPGGCLQSTVARNTETSASLERE